MMVLFRLYAVEKSYVNAGKLPITILELPITMHILELRNSGCWHIAVASILKVQVQKMMQV
jgi:hypothetical protein